ncbi:site-specific integrase [Maribacter cobaltidurans]|uniref:Uncharacterized protein n=1 Tax=Maribacter cobaltidurans TaxID=1178778 RepID=A0A223V6I8_9FLAO|nr:tyrosine-type recombinase/integrase [Maribacter cobaltidurans]ASV31034.1 hypothetical protein CJ263_12890 [Maribacter cobaltidurans]GGD96205.1 hypothetical protein GCM10011412_37880 [Maribacter cobaltidurans]
MKNKSNAEVEHSIVLQILADKIGITKNVTSYVARHSFAICLCEKGVGIDVIGDALGNHSVLTIKACAREFGVQILDEVVEILLR